VHRSGPEGERAQAGRAHPLVVVRGAVRVPAAGREHGRVTRFDRVVDDDAVVVVDQSGLVAELDWFAHRVRDRRSPARGTGHRRAAYGRRPQLLPAIRSGCPYQPRSCGGTGTLVKQRWIQPRRRTALSVAARHPNCAGWCCGWPRKTPPGVTASKANLLGLATELRRARCGRFVRFATHYGFRPDFCHGNDPESKGIVGNLVGYVKRDLIVLAEPAVEDLTMANAEAAGWCAEVNGVVHSEMVAVPAERLETERELLGALPSLRPEGIGVKPVSRKVDKLSCVRFGSARHSVPNRLIGTAVLLVVTGKQVQVREPFTDEVIAEHALTEQPEHCTLNSRPTGSTPPHTQPQPRPQGLGIVDLAFI